MDNNLQEWRFLDPKKSGEFRIGEEIEIEGMWFQVKKINPSGLMLKPIKQPTEGDK